MHKEINIESIQAIEKQIDKGEGDIIKLKRIRNSLLNISTRLPSEILGRILWTVALERDFSPYPRSEGLKKGSYRFLLVCDHWFRVASKTPELWSFWGNRLEEWNKWYRNAGAAPADLVLDGYGTCLLEPPLWDELRDRATKNLIRKIHLHHRSNLLGSILSALTPDGGAVQQKCIQSIILDSDWGSGIIPEELSSFFAQSSLPQLQYLEIAGTLTTTSLHHIQTTCLTTLSLRHPEKLLPVHTPQLLSILALNPYIRHLTLHYVSPPDSLGGSVVQVPLHHLKTISLRHKFHCVFGLLQQLELPEVLDCVDLTFCHSMVEDVYKFLAPYIKDLFQHDIRFRDWLEVGASFFGAEIYVHVNLPPKMTSGSEPPLLSASFLVLMTNPPPASVMNQLCLDLMALIPQEHVASMDMMYTPEVQEELFLAMPNIEHLYLCDVTLSDGFLQPNPDGPHANMKLLPSLQSLCLEDVTVGDEDEDGDGDEDEDGDEGGGEGDGGGKNTNWEPLKAYLAHQTSEGQNISLEVISDDLTLQVVKEIKDLVGKFTYSSCSRQRD